MQDRVGGSLGPGTLLDSRYRIASVAARSTNDLVLNALDERSRQRVRLRVTAAPTVQALAELRHPNVASALRTGGVRIGESRWSYTVLEWFDGAPLALPPEPIGDVASVRAWAANVLELLDAVEQAHRHRAHGDLALGSIWRGSDGRLRIVDLAAPDGPSATERVPYASPERLRGQPRDARSDVYSLGVLAYALATGAPPYGTEPLQARTGHLLWRLPEHPAIPAAFLAVLRTAMEKHPHHRFASVARMKAAFEQALRSLDGAVIPYDQAPERIPVVPDVEGPILEDLLSLDASMEPAPVRTRARRRPRPAPPVIPLLLSSVGLGLSVFAWAALIGLFAAVASGRLGF